MRKGEDHMHIAHRQQFLTAFGKPLIPSVGLALGTVPVTATVITDAQVTALIALINVSAQGNGSAATDGMQGTPLPAVKLQLSICTVPVLVQYSGQFKIRPHHYLPYNRSSGLTGGLSDGFATCR